jgi:hypothetical protein
VVREFWVGLVVETVVGVRFKKTLGSRIDSFTLANPKQQKQASYLQPAM